MSDPGAELTRITDELVTIQARINELRDSGAAEDSPEMVELQRAAGENDADYQRWSSAIRDTNGIV